jgi:D-alanine transaminase
MSRIAYVNGRYLPHARASVHVEDRGNQFADGVYEVIAVAGGRRIDEAAHLDRLERSLGEIRLRAPLSRRVLAGIVAEVVRRNRVAEGIVYLQISRGVARRDHAFPRAGRPTVIVTARPTSAAARAAVAAGVAVITLPDIRWKRNDIKSISLLPNVLGKQMARESGAFEAWLVNARGQITEGTTTNAWIVDGAGALRTHPLGGDILGGVTRARVAKLARAAGYPVVERAFTPADAKGAREAFLTSTTHFVVPVVRIDDAPVANGAPGSVSRDLLARYRDFAAERACG